MASDVEIRRSSAGSEESDLELGFLASSVGYHLKRAYLRVHDDFIVTLADLQLRPQVLSALSLIADNPGIIQSALARVLAIERSNIVLIIDDLVGRGWVTRNAVPHDRRVYALHATAAGRECCRLAVARIVQHEERMLSALSARERAALLRALNRVGTVDTASVETPVPAANGGRP
jgi:DNA-binding MarR family transcriptional regulator